MSAHPMIQPIDWNIPPESMIGSVPEERRKIYQVIWDSALACTLKPPILQHSRLVYECDFNQLVVASVEPVTAKLGYWRFRRDYPSYAFPTQIMKPTETELKVTNAWISEVNSVSLGNLILAMQTKGIGTAASTSELLKAALTQKKNPLVTLSHADIEKGEPMAVTVTETGATQLKIWQQNDLVGISEKTNSVIQEIADGSLGYREGLDNLFSDKDSLNQEAARYIDTQCERWKGLGREEGLKALNVGLLKPPHYEGLPHWLDPEVILPNDHPLRDIRKRMEEELISDRHDWLSTTHEIRAEARLQWLKDHQAEYVDIMPPLDGDEGQFNVLRYWLTGIKHSIDILPHLKGGQ